MAKIRIYELARELNLANKELLEKIADLNMPVKSHMSSLDEDQVQQVKALILGTHEEKIVETRVRPTIIRRRRKIVKTTPPPAEAAPEAETAEPPPAEEAVPPEAAPAEEEPESAEAVELPPAEPETAEPPPKKPAKKLPKEKPAKIISRPPEPEPEQPERAVEEEPEAAPEKESAAPEPEPAEEVVAAPESPAAEETVPAVEAAPVTDKEEAPEEIKPEAPKPAKPAPAKKKPKVPKETPAKIISRPKIPIPPREPTTPAKRRPAAAAATQQPDQDAGKGKRKKKKGRPGAGEESQDRRFFKKKIAFKRKEVIEGAALYSGGKRRKMRKSKKKNAEPQRPHLTEAKAIKRRIKIDDTINLAELAKRMGIKANEIILKLMSQGVMATVNQTLDFDTASLMAAEFSFEVERAAFEEETILRSETNDDPEKMSLRPPVVTIMGHVDHGKTSLLDVIRESRVTDSEAGGITQHIGAYHVKTGKGQIVFLDTPGHEAFTAMRSRGASVTDLVILVVAADDGVMPQTIEAINHSKAAEVPIIVAVNKMDKADADPDRVMRQLAEHGLNPEDWGGDTIFIPVSAKARTGIDDLLEMVVLQSEMLELKANPDKLALGRVVEAKLDAGRGAVATVLIQEGTLKHGDPVVCGVHYGKIRSLINDQGQTVIQAGPSMPVEILGLSGVPEAGDELVALADEKDAKQVSQHRAEKQRSQDLSRANPVSLENIFERMQEGDLKELSIILKADVHGSIEALRDSLEKLTNDEVKINIIHAATGTITESDIFLASGSEAIIIGFNVRPSTKVQAMAQEEQVDIRYHNIIYNVIKEIKGAIVGMMESTYEERVLGRAEVRQVFHVPKVGAVAGSYVTDGKFERSQLVRLLRDGVVTFEGKISSLRRFKDDVKEVQSGYECGIGIENYNDVKVGDELECYYLEEMKPEID